MKLSTMHNGLAEPERDVDLTDLASIADELVEQVSEARREYGELRAQLDAVDGLDADGGGAAVDPEPRSERDIHQQQREQGRLLALSYAVEGRSAEEALAELRNSFDIEGAEAIVDSVFVEQEPERPRRFGRFRRRT